MIKVLPDKRYRKRISWVLLHIMLLDLFCPNLALALSSGPVQPEVQSFEPVGTTDMVDMFTGDFVYNIPLLDVEGYPLNISYHGGVTMDQEASWVGLGWNINPGAINRSVRGLPDEFNGERIEKELHIKEEVNTKLGISAVTELAGLGEPMVKIGGTMGGYLNISNYRGVSVDMTMSAGVNTRLGMVSAGMNIGASVGSQAGASIDYGTTIGAGVSQVINKDLSAGGSFNMNSGGTYSPRSGLRRSIGLGLNLGVQSRAGSASLSTGTSVPVGLQNYTAAVTNASYMNSWGGQIKLGTAIPLAFLAGKISGSVSRIGYGADGSRRGYGYFNLANASRETHADLLDFSREKDGMYNTTMQLLPQAQLTYDVYNVSGQGTGGAFRPFRNDIGSVYDPVTSSKQASANTGVEAGLGAYAAVGAEVVESKTTTESGPWSDYERPFVRKRDPGYYEDIYFKEAGELSTNNESYLNGFAHGGVVKPEDLSAIPSQKRGSDARVVRANHISTLSASDEDSALLLSGKMLESYRDSGGFRHYPAVPKDQIPRLNRNPLQPLSRRANHITEIVQTQKDGRRYVYGLPVLHNVQREVTFAVDTNTAENKADLAQYLVAYSAGADDSKDNRKGLDQFYSSTVTPSYVSSHLLSSVLSADYVDVTGNGISDDDLGTYTKFNYSRKSADYRWRAPVQSGKAQFMPGYKTDRKDDKAGYMIGSREQWVLHSVETRNYVAEFYVSQRADAQGVLDRILNGGLPDAYIQAPFNAAGTAGDNKSYKLDSIALYNKHDRFINGAAARPIKTILFSYDYSLCRNVPNASPGSGKLTLRKIQTRYGSSNLNLSAAYQFSYNGLNPDYEELGKDRWGTYKPNNPVFNNAEFPFTRQTDSTNHYAGAWSLTDIGLPSGGVIKVDYESDDYAYVQDKQAMQMFAVNGVGMMPGFFQPADALYWGPMMPQLCFYFTRRPELEDPALGPKGNYLNGTNLLYYHMPVTLVGNKTEPVKGYAEVADVSYCSDGIHGCVLLQMKSLKGASALVNPVTYTALNMGRYNLPHILFPGADPDASDIDNIVAGLRSGFKSLFQITQNPLNSMIRENKARRVDLAKAFIRLSTPGLKKKGGGHRVKTIRFFDNWDAMAGGKAAVYGRQYKYTVRRDNSTTEISSGVASYEPMIGGDELPQRVPVGFTAQEGSDFPPNDPVDLYQEMPVGESFYPAPVVGYSNVTVSSIHAAEGRSSQTEDIYGFYTARDFPVQVQASPVNSPAPRKDISWTNVTIEQAVTQGFSLVLNDMHGKARNTEHWVLKTNGATVSRELINMQRYEYLTESGRLSNMVPVFDYDAKNGRMSVARHRMGIETDMTVDTRMRREHTEVSNLSASTETFPLPFFGIPGAWFLGYPFTYTNDINFRCATVTKLTQQYGILSKVISSNEGAVTELRNEVFDANSGNVLVTSVNNEFKDRVYHVSYPAYWAYKELGPAYENQQLKGSFAAPVLVDSLGKYSRYFVNYNPAFSSQYQLPGHMPVARVRVDDELPKFKLGDEMLLYSQQSTDPIRTWTMGYTSDSLHCYLVMAPRDPYRMNGAWQTGNNLSGVRYRVVRSGNRNRLGETMQTYSTTDSSSIFPYLKDTLQRLIDLEARTYKHQLSQVFAPNQSSDSLNPFVTGKVGQYRPELVLQNVKNRIYAGGSTRHAGIFASPSYWQTQKDPYRYYCQDSVICFAECPYNCPSSVDSLLVTYLGGDSMRVTIVPFASSCPTPQLTLTSLCPSMAEQTVSLPDHKAHSVVFRSNCLLSSSVAGQYLYLTFNNGCCPARFQLGFNLGNFSVDRVYFNETPALNQYIYSPSHSFHDNYMVNTAYRVRKKIQLGSMGHYEQGGRENWLKQQEVTRYNWFGQEIENKEEGIGYNAAVYGYGQQLPVCVARNARHDQVLFDGFEDYALLQARPDRFATYMPLFHSPFSTFFSGKKNLGNDYRYDTLIAAPAILGLSISGAEAHTGNYSLKANNAFTTTINGSGSGFANGYSFMIADSHKYVVSLWLKPIAAVTDPRSAYTPGDISVFMNATALGLTATVPLSARSPIIDGWQQFEASLDVSPGYNYFQLRLPGGYYYDDVRMSPFAASSKGFVYDPVTRKLMATLDENNYATFYEYDAEGNLIRTKKETEKGILTITESRSTHRKTN